MSKSRLYCSPVGKGSRSTSPRFADEEATEEISAGRDPEALREEMLRSIVPSLLAINDYWHRHGRMRPAQLTAAVFTSGRKRPAEAGHPCPCGSGKKPQQCCRFIN